MDIQVIILAAGKGSRMKSRLPKVLHKLAGKPLVQHVIDNCKSMGAKHCHLVVGHGAELVKEGVIGENIELSFVEQKEQLGTGHAALQAESSLLGETDYVIVTYADMPLLRGETFQQLVDTQ
ncbi:MAG: NTP transferase domain-containing protein, partial [Kangiellaceae bacterium]|nr:NTP transferase domain-containing protein [Kangiellaceae bacterium]